MQELRANLDGMVKAQLGSSQIKPEKRLQIENYVKRILQTTSGRIALPLLGQDERIVGKWRLGFSTEAATLGVFSKEARIYIDILGFTGCIDW
ncbi:MAG: hypothetical protein ACREBR_03815 [bacterium]